MEWTAMQTITRTVIPDIPKSRARDLGYTFRRHYVDQFHLTHVSRIPENAKILDLGGTKIEKRGLFDIGTFGLNVLYTNLTANKLPDIQADAVQLPIRKHSFDCVICSEMLEHTPDPKSVIEEISRVLKPGGIVLICVPFSTRIHADPYDYGRYTDYFWSETLTRYGFKIEVIEKQGLFWSVILDMVRDGLYAVTAQWKSSFVLNLVFTLFGYARLMAIRFDRKLSGSLQSSLAGYTTGFGIKAYKE